MGPVVLGQAEFRAFSSQPDLGVDAIQAVGCRSRSSMLASILVIGAIRSSSHMMEYVNQLNLTPELALMIVVAVVAIVSVGAIVAFIRGGRLQRSQFDRFSQVAEALTSLSDANKQLHGRMSQLSENHAQAHHHLGERLQAQERMINRAMEERLADLTRRVGNSLTENTAATGKTLTDLREKLVAIDAAQRNLSELSGQVSGLQQVLSNKQARGAFGEIQLNDLVKNALPPSAYEFQASIGENRRVDCLLILPHPPGPIAIDAKFPLESYRALRDAEDASARQQAGRTFSADIMRHVNAIAERYIVPGETAESALMFLPSEAIYAELHANFPDLVEATYRKRVWIVSPTTLMATLNTVRAVLRDSHIREQAHVIQKYVHALMDDLGRLDERVGKLQTHFNLANRDIEQIRTSTGKVLRHGERIAELEMGETPQIEQTAPDEAPVKLQAGAK